MHAVWRKGAHLLPSRRAWMHCRASRLSSSSSVDASTLEDASELAMAVAVGSAALSCTATDGCAPHPLTSTPDHLPKKQAASAQLGHRPLCCGMGYRSKLLPAQEGA